MNNGNVIQYIKMQNVSALLSSTTRCI